MRTSAITWVEFMPQGHTHLVRSALKLVAPTKALPVAKIKEVMFKFILKILNKSAPRTDFFKARKAAKPRKRTRRRKGKGGQSDGMAVDTPKPSMAVEGSTQEPEALRGNGNPPPLEGSREPLAHTQHFPGPSSEELWDGGSSSEDPRASLPLTPLPIEPKLQAPVATLDLSFHTCKLLWSQEKMAAQHVWTALRSLSLVPLIASVLGKCPPSPPPPSSPPLALGSPVSAAVLNWHAWMQHKWALYHQNNLGKSMLVTVTPLDLHNPPPYRACCPLLQFQRVAFTPLPLPSPTCVTFILRRPTRAFDVAGPTLRVVTSCWG